MLANMTEINGDDMQILKGLNIEQQQAVVSTEGYIRVIAGAGTGKTKVLTQRYIYLVKKLGISPANILCVTFTNKAANEMKARIRKVIEDNDSGNICTFHSFGKKILREDSHIINYPTDFKVMDTEDVEQVLKAIYRRLEITTKTFTFDKIKEALTSKKAGFWHIKYLSATNNTSIRNDIRNCDSMLEKIMLEYLYEQKKSFALDFNDLITIPLYILENYRAEREKWQSKIMYAMVDEFQDISVLQYRMMRILSDYHKNLFVVGDPNQTIYTWRGANIDFILDFEKTFKPSQTIKLYVNYRSTPEILNVANSLIEHNKKRIQNEMKPTIVSGSPALYSHFASQIQEAKGIAKQIAALLRDTCKYSDICVLYRASHVSRAIEQVFIEKNIPYVLYSGIEFYKRKEIKDILAYLSLLVFEDDISFLRVVNTPRRNIGEKKIKFLTGYSENNNCSLFTALQHNLDNSLFSKTYASNFVGIISKYKQKIGELELSDIIDGILKDTGYEDMLRTAAATERLDNLAEFKLSIYELEKNNGESIDLMDYLQEIALFTNADRKTDNNSVKMMTIHTAKGLEFPYVFVCGLNEGIFPSSRTSTALEMEEERRIAYVAFTRAKKQLFLSDSEGYNWDSSFRFPSRFIFNINKDFLHYSSELEESLIEYATEYIHDSEYRLQTIPAKNSEKPQIFEIGNCVLHDIFGRGIITEINLTTGFYQIKFDNLPTSRSISVDTKLTKCN